MFNRPTLTIAQLLETAEFKSLNEQQALFVRLYAENGGDQFAAFNASYKAPSIETARRGSYAVLNRKSIRAAINVFLKKTSRELFLEEVTRASRSKTLKPSVIRALELRAQLEFGMNLKSLRQRESISPTETPKTPVPVAVATKALEPFDRDAKYEVGSKAIFKGRRIVITALDPESKRAVSYEWLDQEKAS